LVFLKRPSSYLPNVHRTDNTATIVAIAVLVLMVAKADLVGTSIARLVKAVAMANVRSVAHVAIDKAHAAIKTTGGAKHPRFLSSPCLKWHAS
jgi:hypothetical protein